MAREEDDAQRLMHDLYRIARSRHALFQDLLARYGVTLHQFHLLYHMKICGKVRVTDLSEMMLVSKPTASRMLNALCEKGLARKGADGSDKRLVQVELTPWGERVVEEVHRRQREILSHVLGKIRRDELESFLVTMEKVAEGLRSLSRAGGPGEEEC